MHGSKAGKTGKAPRGRRPKSAQPPAGDEHEHVIRRYGNRRLYDVKLRRVTTVDELIEMVRRGEDFRIKDGDTGEDITKRVLVQYILEKPNVMQLELLPIELLRLIVAVRSQPIANWLNEYLLASARFIERQTAGLSQMGDLAKGAYEKLFPWLQSMPWAQPPGGAAPAEAPKPRRK